MMVSSLRCVRSFSSWSPVFRADVEILSTSIYARIGKVTTIFTENENGVITPIQDKIWVPFRMQMGRYKYSSVELTREEELDQTIRSLEGNRALERIGHTPARVDSMEIRFIVERLNLGFNP